MGRSPLSPAPAPAWGWQPPRLLPKRVPPAPGLEGFTIDVLFWDLWLRPGLAPRDRSLVTVSTLIALGQVAQIPYHLNKAMDNGLTRAQAGEVVTHLAFYAGWPNAFSAVPVVKDVFDSRRN
jgi:4-carboxymuconolactone decarboxylase